MTAETTTKGPLTFPDGYGIVHGQYPYRTLDDGTQAIAYVLGGPMNARALANGRLLAAAFNSYQAHFGAGAVEAAEQDLLGEALGVIRELATDDWLADDTMDHMPGIKRARALLSWLPSSNGGTP